MGTQDKKITLYTVFDYMVPHPCGVNAQSCLECTLENKQYSCSFIIQWVCFLSGRLMDNDF